MLYCWPLSFHHFPSRSVAYCWYPGWLAVNVGEFTLACAVDPHLSVPSFQNYDRIEESPNMLVKMDRRIPDRRIPENAKMHLYLYKHWPLWPWPWCLWWPWWPEIRMMPMPPLSKLEMRPLLTSEFSSLQYLWKFCETPTVFALESQATPWHHVWRPSREAWEQWINDVMMTLTGDGTCTMPPWWNSDSWRQISGGCWMLLASLLIGAWLWSSSLLDSEGKKWLEVAKKGTKISFRVLERVCFAQLWEADLKLDGKEFKCSNLCIQKLGGYLQPNCVLRCKLGGSSAYLIPKFSDSLATWNSCRPGRFVPSPFPADWWGLGWPSNCSKST